MRGVIGRQFALHASPTPPLAWSATSMIQTAGPQFEINLKEIACTGNPLTNQRIFIQIFREDYKYSPSRSARRMFISDVYRLRREDLHRSGQGRVNLQLITYDAFLKVSICYYRYPDDGTYGWVPLTWRCSRGVWRDARAGSECSWSLPQRGRGWAI